MQAGREFVAIWRHEKRNPTSHVFTADNLFRAVKALKYWHLDHHPDAYEVEILDGARTVRFGVQRRAA